MAGHARSRKLAGSIGTAVPVALVSLVTLGLAAYAAAASYESVSQLAAAHAVPLPRLNPAGIDGGLAGVIGVDILLTWRGRPVGWLRAAARLFAAGTVAANVMAGWPDPAGVGLRVAAPVLIVVLTEAARTVLLHRAATAGEAIPAARWLLAPWQTFTLWRRMRLWGMTSYPEAVRLDLARRRAEFRLADRYGPAWRDLVPADLAWMLRAGVLMTEALQRAEELCAAPLPEAPASVSPEAPAAPSGGAPVTPPGGLARTSPEALSEVPARPSPRPRRLVPARASDEDLAALLLPLLADGRELTPTGVVKVVREAAGGKHGIGHERAGKVLALATQQASRVVSIGERRQA